MIVAINKPSTSFRAASDYLLYDKPGRRTGPRPTTSHRVAWTETRNTRSEDPEAAVGEMLRTAADASHLKAAAGLARNGRPLQKPVKTLSLSWAPGMRPSKQDMLAAADDFLKAMGWTEHQTLIVAHRDTVHAHIHLLINRVHPLTGATLNDRGDFRRALRWSQPPQPSGPERRSRQDWPRSWAAQKVITAAQRHAWSARRRSEIRNRHAAILEARCTARNLHRSSSPAADPRTGRQPMAQAPAHSRDAPVRRSPPSGPPRLYEALRYPDREHHPERALLCAALAAEFRLLRTELSRRRSPATYSAVLALEQSYRARRAALRSAFAADDRHERQSRRNVSTGRRAERSLMHPPPRSDAVRLAVSQEQLPHL